MVLPLGNERLFSRVLSTEKVRLLVLFLLLQVFMSLMIIV